VYEELRGETGVTGVMPERNTAMNAQTPIQSPSAQAPASRADSTRRLSDAAVESLAGANGEVSAESLAQRWPMAVAG
jgi:hypothetical protein